MTSTPRVVRLSCEHGSPWPLWDEDGSNDAADWPQLDPRVLAALEGWVAHWYRHFDWERGWDAGTWRDHAAEGQRLGALLAQRLGPGWQVQLAIDPVAPPTLTDGVVGLRSWRQVDVPSVLAACQDPDIQRWLPVPVPYREQDAHGFVAGFVSEEWSSGRGAPLAVVDADTGELLGSVGLKGIDPVTGTAEVGYWVAPWARGRGVAVRAARMLCDWAFGELSLERVELLVDPHNTASCTVAERLGAVRDDEPAAPQVLHGTRRPTVRYELARRLGRRSET